MFVIQIIPPTNVKISDWLLRIYGTFLQWWPEGILTEFMLTYYRLAEPKLVGIAQLYDSNMYNTQYRTTKMGNV